MIKNINHIAIVVPELTAAIDFWVAKLGLALDHVEGVPSQAVEVAFLPVGDTAIELLQPTDEASGVARYMQKRGPGIHHICFEVDDIGATLDQLRAEGVPLIDETATVGSDGRKYAFVHPKGTGGVLVELYELAT